MQLDTLAVRLRPRTSAEAGDLGVRLCQNVSPSVYRCYMTAFVPVAVVALASFEISAILPNLILWWMKPWLDRTIVFVMSRAAFGQPTTVGDVWRAQREVWWRDLVHTLTMRRLSPWRSLTQPVLQLEGVSPWKASARVRLVRQRNAGAALLMTQAFSLAEVGLAAALLSLVFWFAPAGQSPDLSAWIFGGDPGVIAYASPIAYVLTVMFVEPFYVASGFAMYLNRRAELEGWDIEQEFRRVFRR